MRGETRPELNLPEQLTLALKLLAESEGRLSLMEETLRCLTEAARLVREARRGREEKMAGMTERILSIRRNITRRREEAGTKEEPQIDGPTTE